MEAEPRALVCGAGPGGLAAAAALKRAGVPALVLERAERVGESWRRRYEGLSLNTLGWLSGLPGYRAKLRRYGEYPTREKWIEYLEDYAAHHGLEIEFGTEVERIDRANGGWRVGTSAGAREAPIAVVAMGSDHKPWMPDWPGREGFQGELLHAADYRSPKPFHGRDVLVVGPGNTGSELATLLTNGGATRVRAAMRTPPNIFPRKWLGLSLNLTALGLEWLPRGAADAVGRATQRMIYGNLSEHGLPFPQLGLRSSLEQKRIAPAIDAGFVEAVKAGRIELVPTIERFEGRDVLLVDGTRIQPDAVIAATGYRRGLEPLVGHLGVLDERGFPAGAFERGVLEQPHAPGLFFIGYRAKISGQLRLMRIDSRRIARLVKRRVRTRQPRRAAAPA
ncbi:MAG: flavin-containing monooxygenase [Thermoleophilaceae bacterium]